MMDKEYYDFIKEMWASLLEPYNVDANTHSSTGEVSEKKLTGKLFSRENIEKSKGEDFDDLLWPAIIKVNTTKQ